MNLSHLGDALDHWKGSVIETIRDEKLQVVPMLTDLDRWTPEHFETYARLLHRKSGDVVKKGKDDLFSNRTRPCYFSDLGEQDLFLDPDIGIAGGEKTDEKHVRPSEIAGLLSESKSRLLLIYQHASHNKDGFREKLELLRKAEGLKGCHMFAYDSGAVSMVVISRNRERTDRTRDRFKCWLGPIASTRIIP